MAVEYYSKNKFALNSYQLLDIQESNDRREFTVRVMRDGGGIACIITVRRGSAQEGSQVTMTHSQIHVSGLREVYNLYKMKISSGIHYNSMRYKNFYGEFTDSSRRKMRFVSEVKQSNGSFREKRYDLELRSVIKGT